MAKSPSKPKPKKKTSHPFLASPAVMGGPIKHTRHRLFMAHMRNALAKEIEAKVGLTFFEAKSMTFDIQDEDITGVSEACGLGEMSMSADQTVTAEDGSVTVLAGGPFLDSIYNWIKNIDPEVKRAILDALLKLLGF